MLRQNQISRYWAKSFNDSFAMMIHSTIQLYHHLI